jgi:hypothetical protein
MIVHKFGAYADSFGIGPRSFSYRISRSRYVSQFAEFIRLVKLD